MQRFVDARALSDTAVAFRVLSLNYVALFDPAAINELLVGRAAEVVKDKFTQDLRRVLGTGLLTSEGELWRRRRRLSAPFFQRKEIVRYEAVMVDRAAAFVNACPTDGAFDMHAALMHLTLDILVRALFGTEPTRADEVATLLDRLSEDYHPARQSMRVFMPAWWPVASRRRLARVSASLDAILFELIEKRRAAAAATEGDDLLGRLMRAKDEEGALSERALRDEAMTLFLAGHETTALALTYVLRLLALNDDVAQKLRGEIDGVLGGREPRMADLPSLPYARAVLDEALRLYPPAWAFGRESDHDVVIGDIEVPAGTQILVAPFITHRDERFYAEPDRFRPERWLEPGQSREAYLPFGAGPRVCIGSHFALAEAQLALAVFMQRARFTLEPDQPFDLTPAVTLRPAGPVLMRAHRRPPLTAS